ncbi:MAG: hypothetical protein ACMXX7_00185 [Candidatus Woesearchaeota archaeon]
MMDLGALCAGCKSKVVFNEAVMFQGKVFCSNKCKESFLQKS